MSVKTEDTKPSISVDGHDVFNIPVEEEELDIADSHGQSKIWAMKIPRFLLERWERVKEGGVHLGTLVVDNSATPPKITLKLPTEDDDKGSKEPARKRAKLNTDGIPDEYAVVMPSERVKNTYIFSEAERVWVAKPGSGGASQRRKHQKARPRLIGALDHEASVRPVNSAKYLKILEQRRLENENSKRPIVQLDDKNMSQAKLNQLASGFSNASSKLGKGMVMGDQQKVNPGERFARLERHELIERLFALFKDKPYWSITALKATLQQPDTWLREVLKEVAVLIREGKYANMWELQENWKEAGGDTKPDVKDGDDDDESDDEEEDDEDDLEEVV